MTATLSGFGWPTINPSQQTPWGFSPFGSQGIGSYPSSVSSLQQQVLQLLHVVPQQLQNLQQQQYVQQQQLQQLQQLLLLVPQQLQYAVQQIAHFVPQQPGVGMPFQAIPTLGLPIFSAQPGHLM